MTRSLDLEIAHSFRSPTPYRMTAKETEMAVSVPSGSPARCAIPWLDAPRLVFEPAPHGLLHQTREATIRTARVDGGAARVAVLSFRTSYAKKSQLWRSALDLVEGHITGQSLHPNFVQVLALAGAPAAGDGDNCLSESISTGAEPSGIVMEWMPSSVYEVLHCDHLAMTASDIEFIATEVLSALQFLHRSGQSFGSTLTSRKVMLGGTRHVKLRRFCLERIRRETGSSTGSHSTSSSSPLSSASSQYVLPVESITANSVDATLRHAQRQDLYAFGMLLLEMCTRVKPTPEILNSLSLAGQIEPRLERIVRATLDIETKFTRSQPLTDTFEEPAELLQFCIQLLAECTDADAVVTSTQRQPSHSFSSFLHADRYFQEMEDRIVEQRLAERMAQSTVALKRLAAVEDELVEEQRNFEVVVNQLEQLRLDKATDELHLSKRELEIQRLHDELRATNHAVQMAHERLELVATRNQELERDLSDKNDALQRGHADRMAVERERQALLIEVLRLKDEKRECVVQKHEVEDRLAQVAAQVGGEKDALEELDARWRQTIHLCEQEQRARRGVERQLEALSSQLTAMEDERSRYTASLQIAPTGSLDARSSQQLVVELKEKEIQSLRIEIRGLATQLASTQHDLHVSERERQRLDEVICVEMQQDMDALKHEMEQRTRHNTTLKDERDSLQTRLLETARLAEQQAETIEALESRVSDLQKQAADAEKARRLRQCLTPNCDAPRYLVKPSGFCIDCEEKMAKQRGKSRASVSSSSSRGGHRRQRSLDGAQAILNNTKNTPLIELRKRMEVVRDCDDETRDESALELVALLKQLGKMLKDTATLKEDLPECGVLRAVLLAMEHFLSSLPVVIEATKTLSIAVFNHDRNRIILVSEGAVEIVLRMMKTFPKEAKVQEMSAVLLTNLSHHCESNRQRILVAGGVDAVLEAMQSFPRVASIQKKCCWALLTLAGSDVMCEKIASLGGVGATLAAMLNCPNDADVQHYGSWALLNLIAGTQQLQDFARREGIVEVVEAALACFSDHAGIHDKCHKILELIHTTDAKSS